MFSYFAFEEISKNKKENLANKYNASTINYISGNNNNIENEMIEIINLKDKTYSPLALYFLLDNNIINSREKVNRLFDTLIEEIKLDKEIKNLIIYKKGLYNSDYETENKE